MPNTPPAPTPAPINNIPSEERILAALSYFPFLFVGALIMKPESKFCQMHAKQGMILSGIAFVILFVLAAIPMIGSLLFLALVGAIAIGGFQAYSGMEWKMPILHDLAMKINVDKLFAGTTIKPTETKSETPAVSPAAPAAPTPPSSEKK